MIAKGSYFLFALLRKYNRLIGISFSPCLLAGILFFASSTIQAQHHDSRLRYIVSVKSGQNGDLQNEPPIKVNLGRDTFDANLKQAVNLFKRRSYKEAIPILEILCTDSPNDDQAVFGLGVALVMTTREIIDSQERKKIIAQAISTLETAKKLGMDDFILDTNLKALFSDSEQDRTAAVESLASLWIRHPPLIFDNAPPKGIHLPNGYRHKSSRDFEGETEGVIWKPGGLKINYEFAGQFQTDAINRFDKNDWAWYQERIVGDHKFKCLLTKDNWLAISVMLVAREEYSIATFGCQISNKEEIEEVLSIVCGLKERSSELYDHK